MQNGLFSAYQVMLQKFQFKQNQIELSFAWKKTKNKTLNEVKHVCHIFFSFT